METIWVKWFSRKVRQVCERYLNPILPARIGRGKLVE
jgi:hypothetical protein